MKVMRVEVVHSKKSVRLPVEWKPAWWEPDGKPTESFGFSFYRVHTDKRIVGVGPYGVTRTLSRSRP